MSEYTLSLEEKKERLLKNKSNITSKNTKNHIVRFFDEKTHYDVNIQILDTLYEGLSTLNKLINEEPPTVPNMFVYESPKGSQEYLLYNNSNIIEKGELYHSIDTALDDEDHLLKIGGGGICFMLFPKDKSLKSMDLNLKNTLKDIFEKKLQNKLDERSFAFHTLSENYEDIVILVEDSSLHCRVIPERHSILMASNSENFFGLNFKDTMIDIFKVIVKENNNN